METTKARVCAQSLSCVWLFCDPMDCSPPGSSVHGISQAGILEWVAISSSRGSSQPGMKPMSLSSLHRQVDSLPLSHQGSPDQDRASWNFRTLEIREDMKSFWKEKKKSHTLYKAIFDWRGDHFSLPRPQINKILLLKTMSEMFRIRKDTHQSKVFFPTKSCHVYSRQWQIIIRKCSNWFHSPFL